MKNSLSLIFIGLVFSISASAQSPLPERIVAALDSFTLFRPQEKTYLQTDRDQYVAGETIWFNAYCRLNEKPTILSRVIYVDLVDRNGKLIDKKMLALKDGTAPGSIELNQQLAGDHYFLRCYSLWMLNFPDFIYEKTIKVLNNGATSGQKNPVSSPNLRIEFFPEGGNLIHGLRSIVAFKTLDEKNNPVELSGSIVNSKNQKIATFKTVHDGMGSFELTPSFNEKYTALVTGPDGKEKTFPLPAVIEEGITLTVDNKNSSRTFLKVERSEKNKEKYNKLLIVAQLHYQVAYMGQLNIDENLDAAAINKKNLPAGIMQVTVLNEDGLPLAERLVFISNHSLQHELLQSRQVDPQKRKKNLLVLNTTEFGKLKASVSITNGEMNGAEFGPGILSSFLLTGDLKGQVHDPGFYFKDKEPLTLEFLDLLMRTHGWRRFRMEEMIDQKYSTLHYPFETGLSVTGKIFESNGKTGLAAGKVNVIVKGIDSTHVIAEAKSGTGSSFVIPDLNFNKEALVHYQGSNLNRAGAIVSVRIDSSYFDTLNKARINSTLPVLNVLQPDPVLQLQLTEKQKADSFYGKTLNEVVLKSRRRSETDSLNAMYASDLFYNSDQTLVMNEKINYFDIWQFLRSQVAGLDINQTDTGMQANFRRYSGLDLFSENTSPSTIQFFLNEVPVDIQIIDALNPTDVAIVKVYSGNTGIALGATRGAIALYTHKGRSFRDWRQKGFDFFKRSGYSVTREYFAMDYSRIPSDSIASDIRPTIYWNPELTIKDGQAQIEFYNDDVSKKFLVTIEGMDEKGRLLFVRKLIQ